MIVISFVQKPYDLLINLEYLHLKNINKDSLTVAIIGKHSNATNVQALCEKYSINYKTLPDPDLYQKIVPQLNLRFRHSLLLEKFLKLILVPASYLFWIYSALNARKLVSNWNPDIVLSDAWRSKCIYWAAINNKFNIVLHDGGFSTLNYNLLPAYNAGGSKALVSRSLNHQGSYQPSALKKYIVQKTPEKAPFFTCYHKLNKNPANLNIIKNNFSYSKSLFKTKKIENKVLIMGLPSLIRIEKFVEIAFLEIKKRNLDSYNYTIEYRFHPADANKSKINEIYKKYIENTTNSHGLNYSFPINSIEFDFLDLDFLPEFIICYNTSSLIWLQKLLTDIINIIVINDDD